MVVVVVVATTPGTSVVGLVVMSPPAICGSRVVVVVGSDHPPSPGITLSKPPSLRCVVVVNGVVVRDTVVDGTVGAEVGTVVGGACVVNGVAVVCGREAVVGAVKAGVVPKVVCAIGSVTTTESIPDGCVAVETAVVASVTEAVDDTPASAVVVITVPAVGSVGGTSGNGSERDSVTATVTTVTRHSTQTLVMICPARRRLFPITARFSSARCRIACNSFE